MAKGCIWGWWDRFHEGMKVALEQAIKTCSGDDLHIVVIKGRDKNVGVNSGFEDFQHRKKKLSQKAEDIKRKLNENTNLIFHEYNTLEEAMFDAHNIDFEVIFVGENVQKNCFGYRDNVSSVNSLRRGAGKTKMSVSTIPTVYEKKTGQVLSSTKMRKREKM